MAIPMNFPAFPGDLRPFPPGSLSVVTVGGHCQRQVKVLMSLLEDSFEASGMRDGDGIEMVIVICIICMIYLYIHGYQYSMMI